MRDVSDRNFSAEQSALTTPMAGLLFVASLVVGIAGGCVVAFFSGVQPDQREPSENDQEPLKQEQMFVEDPRQWRDFSSRAEIAKELQAILGDGTLGEQDESLRSFLDKVEFSEFPEVCYELKDWFETRQSVLDEDGSAAAFAAFDTLADVMVERGGGRSMETLLLYLRGQNKIADDPVSEFATTVFRKWAKQDFDEAMCYLSEGSESIESFAPALNMDLTADLASLWVRLSPNDGVAWLESLRSDLKYSSLQVALGVLHHTEPELAGELLHRHKGIPEREILTEVMAQGWARKDAESALEWAQNLDSSEARIAASTVIGELAGQDFKKARELFQTLNGDARDGAVRDLSHHYYIGEKKRYAEAAQFLELESDGPGRSAGVRDLMANWATAEPAAAGEWLDEVLLDNASLDEAVIEFGLIVAQDFPATGAEWMGRIHDADQRRDFMKQILDPWFRDQPVEVVNWLEQPNSLSEKESSGLVQHYQEILFPKNP